MANEVPSLNAVNASIDLLASLGHHVIKRNWQPMLTLQTVVYHLFIYEY